jgi:hypothetical protein
MPAKDAVPVRPLVLVPAVITLAVTLLRLFGELKGWSPALFNRQAGGGGALVGIAWLVFFFGAYFAWKLLDEGHSPETAWRPLGYGVLGLAIALIPLIGAQALHLPPLGVFVVFVVASLAALFVAMKGWPALGRTLVAYGLAARIPVVVVMLIAMLGDWGTHYDVAPPELPPMGPLQKWFWIGVVPQLTTWMGFTVVFGMIFGGIVAAARLRRRAVAA